MKNSIINNRYLFKKYDKKIFITHLFAKEIINLNKFKVLN